MSASRRVQVAFYIVACVFSALAALAAGCGLVVDGGVLNALDMVSNGGLAVCFAVLARLERRKDGA